MCALAVLSPLQQGDAHVVREQASADRGLWVWQSVGPAAIVRFAEANHVSTLWLATSSSPGPAERERLTRTVHRAARHGVSVAALGGSPRWGTHPAWAVEWARASLRAAPFRGVHLDVEPYALQRWHGDRQRVIRLYLTMLDQVGALRGPLDVDVPFWYGTVRTHGHTLADEVLARVDHVTVMSYRDRAIGPNSIVDVSRDWLRRADAAGVGLRLGAETNRLGGCPQCTFHEEGADALVRQQRRVVDRLAGRPSFDGVAVHDWAGWSALLER